MSKLKPTTNAAGISESALSKGITAKDKSYPIRALVTLVASILLVTYVEIMVLPAIPLIQKDLSTTATIAAWITTVVMLVGAVACPLIGKLADVYGKKNMVVVTIFIYTVGVSLAGFSTSIYVLLFTRAIQGVGLAMIPLSLSLTTDIFPKEQLAAAQGAVAGSAAISTALGLILGAFIMQNLGWQDAFRTAAVVSVLLLVAVIVVLKRDTVSRVKSKIDYIGAILLSSGLALSLVYLTEGSTLGWGSLEELLFIIPGIALILLFFVFESKVSVPLIQLKLLRIRNVLIANLVTIVTGMSNFLLFFAVIYYAELPKPFGLGVNVQTTGLILAPAAVMMLIVGLLAGRLMAKVGPKPIVIGGSSVSILSFILFMVNRGSSIAVSIDIMVAFAGLIATFVPLINMISVSLPRDNVTVGQGLNTMLQQTGSSIAPVVTTSILAAYTQPLIGIINGHAIVLGALPSATAFNIVFSVGIVLGAISLVLALTIKNYAFKRENDQTKQATQGFQR